MNAITRTHAGHWADRPESDTRVSHAEQQDHQIEVGPPSFWMLALLVASPLIVPAVISLVALYYR